MSHSLPRFLPRLLGGCALLFAGLAHAQYAWIDAAGTHHYSDRPPPPGAHVAKMIKAPGAANFTVVPQADATPEPGNDAPQPEPAPGAPRAAPAAPAAGTAGTQHRPTLAEREADFRKRTLARAKEEQKAAAEAKRKQALAQQCASAREYKAQLESGIRMAVTNAAGERDFLSDEERARRLPQANATLQDCR